jgi:hypothetical protein
MRMSLRRPEQHEVASPTATFAAVMRHLAASQASKEDLEAAAVRSRVTQDPRRALRERLAGT